MNDSPPHTAPSLRAIRAKKEALLATAAKYEAAALKARAEAADYEAAERVWLKLIPGQEVSEDDVAKPAGVGKAFLSVGGGPYVQVGEPMVAHSKPLDVPPVPEMIIEALGFANRPMTPNELLAFVRSKYWSTARNTDVGSTAWRMWKDGR